MGFLDSSLAESIYKGFKGKLLSGLIRQYAPPTSGGLDQYGDPIVMTPTDTDMEGFVDDYDDAYRARAAIPLNDLLVNILARSCPDITPGKDDVVKFTQDGTATWYQLRKVKTDPAHALWTCQAFVVPEPAS